MKLNGWDVGNGRTQLDEHEIVFVVVDPIRFVVKVGMDATFNSIEEKIGRISFDSDIVIQDAFAVTVSGGQNDIAVNQRGAASAIPLGKEGKVIRPLCVVDV